VACAVSVPAVQDLALIQDEVVAQTVRPDVLDQRCELLAPDQREQIFARGWNSSAVIAPVPSMAERAEARTAELAGGG
jgi:hypothetical protein